MKRHLLVIVSLLLVLLCGCFGKKKTYDYRIGLDPSWYPLELAGREKQVLAFSIELLHEIAKEKKLNLIIVQMNWDNLTMDLNNENYEAMLSSLHPYLFYQKKYSFSQLYLGTGPALVVPKAAAVDNLDQMKGREIAVMRGSSAALLLQKYPVILRPYDSVPGAFNDILTQSIDGAVVDVMIAQAYTRNIYQTSLKLATGPLTDQGLRLITMYHKSPKLLTAFNEGLSKLKESGRYEKLLQKWGLSLKQNHELEANDQELEELLKQVFM